MKSVSNSYKESMARTFRNTSHLRIGVYKIDTDDNNLSSFYVNAPNVCNNLKKILYPYDVDVDGFVTGEMNNWVIGDTVNIAPNVTNNPYERGFVSMEISNSEGVISLSEFTLTLNFTNPFTFNCIKLEEDSRIDKQNFDFSYSLQIFGGGGVTTVDDIETDYYRCDPIENVTKIVLTKNVRNVAPYNRARLEKIVIGNIYTFTNEEIVNAEWHNESDPLCRRLPEQTLKFDVIDFEGRFDPMNNRGEYDFIDTDEMVTMEYGYDTGGVIEWLPYEIYYIDSKPTYASHTARFSCNKMTTKYNADYYANPVGGTQGQIGQKLRDLTANAGIEADIDYYFTDAIKSRSQLKHDKLSNVILLLANACACRMYFDAKDVLVIEPSNTDNPDIVLDGDTVYYETEKFTVNPKVRNVLWSKHSFDVTNEDYSKNLQLSLGINIIDFGELVSSVNMVDFTGTIIAKCQDSMVVNVTNIGSNPKITGKRVKDSSTDAQLTLNATGEDVRIDNYWISRDQNVVADLWQRYLSKRNVIEFEYRGNPEIEMGDNVYYVDKYGHKRFCTVLATNIRFNGAIRGKLVLKDEEIVI